MKNLSILSILAICFLTLACGDESDSDTGANSTSMTEGGAAGETAEGGAAGETAEGGAAGETAEGGAAGETAEGGAAGDAASNELWNAVCADDSDCAAPINLCSKAPGAAEGYCSKACATTADCPYGDWSCNVIGGCEMPAASWCGPREEIEAFAGIVTACD